MLDEPGYAFGSVENSPGHAGTPRVYPFARNLAVGDSVLCLRPRPFKFEWAVQIDAATCFGLYFQTGQGALISHGELEVARFGADGSILWSSGGADIFTEGSQLLPECIEAVDFNGGAYRFGHRDGRSVG